MKKYLGIICSAIFLLAIHSAQAQSATLMPLKAGDTLVTSSSKDTVSKVITVTGGYSVMGIQVKATKVSGTVAGKVYLYRSMDGVNYTVTDSSAAFVNQTTNTAEFEKTWPGFTYYKIEARTADGTTSTQSVIYRVYYTLRKTAITQ